MTAQINDARHLRERETVNTHDAYTILAGNVYTFDMFARIFKQLLNNVATACRRSGVTVLFLLLFLLRWLHARLIHTHGTCILRARAGFADVTNMGQISTGTDGVDSQYVQAHVSTHRF